MQIFFLGEHKKMWRSELISAALTRYRSSSSPSPSRFDEDEDEDKLLKDRDEDEDKLLKDRDSIIASIDATSAEWETFLSHVRSPGHPSAPKFAPLFDYMQNVRKNLPAYEEFAFQNLVQYIENERLAITNSFDDYNTCAYICEPDGTTKVSGALLDTRFMSDILNDVFDKHKKRHFLYAIPASHVINEGLDTIMNKITDADVKGEYAMWKQHLKDEMSELNSVTFDAIIEKMFKDTIRRTEEVSIMVHEVDPEDEHKVDGNFVSLCEDARRSGIDEGEVIMMHPCLVEGNAVTVAGTLKFERVGDHVSIVVTDDSGHYMRHSGVIISKQYLAKTFEDILAGNPKGRLHIELVSDVDTTSKDGPN